MVNRPGDEAVKKFRSSSVMLDEAEEVFPRMDNAATHAGNGNELPENVRAALTKAKEAVEKARKTIADTLGCEEEEIYFTSGGTESDNWAIKSAVQTAAEQKSEGSNEKEREGETERADLLKKTR